MKKKLFLAQTIISLLFVAACDDNTSDIGIHDISEGITNSSDIVEVFTRSVKLDSVMANSSVNYLGSIVDPETGSEISASFAAQFYSLENYKFPKKEYMAGEVDGETKLGKVQCDSCEVRLYFDSYYGDANNVMKLEIYELSSEEILSEDSTYYSDVNLAQYLPEGAKPLATRVFTPTDYNQSTTVLNSTAYDPNVRVVLPKSLGQRIMEQYFEDPNSFQNSFTFIRKVFPGLYFKTSGGKGTMLSVYVGSMNLYYRYFDEEEDTITEGLTRFASTPEVIQSTRFDNANVDELLEDNSCTYLKTPAGICTEMTLPVDEVFAGEHAVDSVSLASITLNRYNKEQTSDQLDTPAQLLMVRKCDVYDFFRNHKVADGRTSYTTSFNSGYNSYTFGNICRLLSYLKHEKMSQAKAEGMSEDEWAAQNPDWNKVLLIPVSTSTDNNGVLVSVTHNLNLSSVRLVGGTTPLTMQVVYSKFYQK